MSERDLRRRNIPANRRTISSPRTPRSSPETRRKINPEARGHLSRQLENAKILKSSKSESSLFNDGGGEVAVAEAAGVFYPPQTCTDKKECFQEYYNKDAKVVVNVTVEGSPGPVRTMVKLGSNVEETIKLVIKKYNEECRTPPLEQNAAAKYELHQSYFSLESLSMSDLIGDIGSRSFYLRKCSDGRRAEDVSTSTNLQPASSLSLLPSFVSRSITKIIRRTRKFWKLLGCIP